LDDYLQCRCPQQLTHHLFWVLYKSDVTWSSQTTLYLLQKFSWVVC
jgi:hypothetical protein